MIKSYRISCIIIICIIFLQGSVSFAAVSGNEKVKNPAVKIAVFSDPHFYSPDLGVSGSKFDDYFSDVKKLIPQAEAILKKTVDSIAASDADIVLIPGDLTKDGEYINHQIFAGYLQELRSSGKKVYVIDGNHDINNPAAYKYSGNTKTRIRNTSPAEFKKIYNDFGYKEAIAADPDSLSYVVEPVKGLRIIAIDSCIYNNNSSLGHQVTSGEISSRTFAWIEKQLKDAQSKGITVFGMMHHGLVQHFSLQSVLFKEFLIKDWQAMADKLADLGLKTVFTGHYHAQDISKYVSKKGNFIFDIETGSLITYPNPYRIIEFSNDKKLKILSNKIESIDYDLGGKAFQDFSKDFLIERLKEDIPNYLTEALQLMGYGKDQAKARAIEISSTEVIPKTTFADLIVDVLVENYQGDEVLTPELKTALKNMLASKNLDMQLAANALLNICSDPEPSDNNAVIDLGTGKAVK